MSYPDNGKSNHDWQPLNGDSTVDSSALVDQANIRFADTGWAVCDATIQIVSLEKHLTPFTSPLPIASHACTFLSLYRLIKRRKIVCQTTRFLYYYQNSEAHTKHNQTVHVSFYFSPFPTLSALLHTSVSLPACERISWKCKLSSQYALALVALFWFLCPPSSLTLFFPSPFLLHPAFNLPLHSVLDRFCLYHKHHLICCGKHIVHNWRALIDLYNVITPFSNVS